MCTFSAVALPWFPSTPPHTSGCLDFAPRVKAAEKTKQKKQKNVKRNVRGWGKGGCKKRGKSSENHEEQGESEALENQWPKTVILMANVQEEAG